MGNSNESAAADLGFMRALVEESQQGHISKSVGLLLAVAGFVYAIQSFVIWGQMNAYLPESKRLSLSVSVAASAIFVSLLSVVLMRDRKNLMEKSIASRAISAVFGGVGLATTTCVIIFSIITIRGGDTELWQIFGAVVAALQGAAWYAGAIIKKTPIFGAVASGWCLASIALSLLFGHAHYLLCVSIFLLLLMSGPGIFLWRHSPE